MGIGVGRLVETAEDRVYCGRQSGRGVAIIEEGEEVDRCGIADGVGSEGAVDMARGVGSGLDD